MENALTRLRHERGLRQEDLAARSGVTVRTIRRLENEPGWVPAVGTIVGLAAGLEMSPAALMAELLATVPA